MKSRKRMALGRLAVVRMKEVMRRRAAGEIAAVVCKKRKIRRSLRVHNRLLKYRKFGKNWLIWKRRYKRLNLRITFQAKKLYEFIALYQGAKNERVAAENEASFWKSEIEKLRGCIGEEIAERDCKIESLKLENEALKNENGNLRTENERLQNELENFKKQLVLVRPQAPEGTTQAQPVAPTYLLLPPGFQISTSGVANQSTDTSQVDSTEKVDNEVEDLKKRFNESHQANLEAQNIIKALTTRLHSFRHVWDELVAFKPTVMQALQEGLSQILKESEPEQVFGKSLTVLDSTKSVKVEVYKSSKENGKRILAMPSEDGGKVVYRDPAFIGLSEHLTPLELHKCLSRMARLNQKAMLLELKSSKFRRQPSFESITNWFKKFTTSAKESGNLSRAGVNSRLRWFANLFCLFTNNDQKFAIKTMHFIENKMGFSLPDRDIKMTPEQDLKLKMHTNLSWHKRAKIKGILISYGRDVFASTSRVRELALQQQTGVEGPVQKEGTGHSDNEIEEDDGLSTDDQDESDSHLSDCLEEQSEPHSDHELVEGDDETVLTDDVNMPGGSGIQHLKDEDQSHELFFEETLDGGQVNF